MKIKTLAFVFSLFLCGIVGCKNSTIQIIDIDPQTETNKTERVGAFGDMTFIWENWTYGTNRVDRKD